jgi:purine nucleoside phosphorylase
VVLGSGLGGLTRRLDPPVQGVSYSDIPGFPGATV